MKDQVFISKIEVNAFKGIPSINILLSTKERRHLIITGKNGSGKTTLLNELVKFLFQIYSGNYKAFKLKQNELKFLQGEMQFLQQGINNISTGRPSLGEYEKNIKNIEKKLFDFGRTNVCFNNGNEVVEKVDKGHFLISSFQAKREAMPQNPKGIEKIEFKSKYSPLDTASIAFIQYLVNLKAERSFARDDGDIEAVDKINKWFNNLEDRLQDILEDPSLKLVFDRKNYNFSLQSDNNQPFLLTELSDGYSAILSIVTELIMRMDAIDRGNYQLQGVVLIDEIETHLHVNLQKKILPFLIDFFPNLQFIVTTHSPFVLSSVENAVICDLQHQIVTEDLSGYSYDALIESYFSSDKYSHVIQDKLARYEQLSTAQTDDERIEYMQLKQYFSNLPKYLSSELDVKLQQIELARLGQGED